MWTKHAGILYLNEVWEQVTNLNLLRSAEAYMKTFTVRSNAQGNLRCPSLDGVVLRKLRNIRERFYKIYKKTFASYIICISPLNIALDEIRLMKGK